MAASTVGRQGRSGGFQEVARPYFELCAVRRGGTLDEVGAAAAFRMGPAGAFITGSDLLMDGGVIAARRFGRLKPAAWPQRRKGMIENCKM